ncbi:MAG: hydrogenase formation protein HypD [Candidatus Methanofastidiosia archaeon]
MKAEELNSRKTMDFLSKRIDETGKHLGSVKIMHVCGTHEHTIATSGLRSFLPDNIKVVSGPGCPVCITPKEDIEKMIFLAGRGITITTFGDMLNVPTDSGSLADARTKGADVRVVYGIANAIKIAKKEKKEVVHFGIGFETTAPTSSAAVISQPENFSILSVHRTIPEAMDFLVKNEVKVDGFIDPGHVSSIIGTMPYEFISKRHKIPQVVSGFEPGDVMLSILMILKQIESGRCEVENEYFRAVRKEGNSTALKLLKKTFEKSDARWRALPTIPNSGLKVRKKYEEWDAQKRHEDILSSFSYEPKEEEKACRCGEILLGKLEPRECSLFGSVCTPDTPVGPCMVSIEGTCSIIYKYG